MPTRELDCDSAATAFGSLSALTAIAVPELRRRMQTVDVEAFDTRSAAYGFPEATAWLWRSVVQRDDARPIPDAVCWFHATRVPRDTDFRDGLLPLPEAARWLEKLLGPSRPAGAFHDKMEHRSQWGPFGHLVREAAFSPIQNHFFHAPEAVIDLGYDPEAYRAAAVPCIVKFRTREARDDVAELALLYCFFNTWNQPAGWCCSATWNGEGIAVPFEDILRVDFLDCDLFGSAPEE